jgi:Protein of unknown function (DUF2630)
VDDQEITAAISALAAEEQQLEEAHVGEGLSDSERERLKIIETTLDRLWDTLRQRRAKRDAGRDPNEAKTRSADTVEGYQQ